MKNVILMLFILGLISQGQSQVIQLEETDIRFSPKIEKISTFRDGTVYKINEKYTGEFSKNPILFMQQNFDIHEFISSMDDEGYDSYVVDFRTKKGHLEARFNNKGDLVKTNQNFRDVPMPLPILRNILLEHNSWTITGNKYIASGNGDGILKEKYIVRLQREDKNKKIKITPSRDLGVATAFK